MIVYRIRQENIVSELYVPNEPNGQSVVILPGLPSILYKNKLSTTLVELGYTVYHPFYSGSIDSDDEFLPRNCIADLSTMATMASSPNHQELYFHKIVSVPGKVPHLIGTSFGASIACYAAKKAGFASITLLAPVLTYREDEHVDGPTFTEQMDALLSLLVNGYPHSYRIPTLQPWQDFLHGRGEQPYEQLSAGDKNILVLHGENDSSVRPQTTQNILAGTQDVNLRFSIVPNIGHSLNDFAQEEPLALLKDFLDKNRV